MNAITLGLSVDVLDTFDKDSGSEIWELAEAQSIARARHMKKFRVLVYITTEAENHLEAEENVREMLINGDAEEFEFNGSAKEVE